MRNRLAILSILFASVVCAQAPKFDFRVLATKKTSTMEKEMNAAAEAGYVFQGVMGGETALGGNEVVVVMARNTGAPAARNLYKLLATSKTSTMQKEMQQAADDGFEYLGQTVFESSFGGKEVSVIMVRDMQAPAHKTEYRLLSTARTSTMQKELQEAGAAGFSLVGMTVAKTAFGGAELVSILKKAAAE